MNKRMLIVAGEASGDLHGARLLGELRAQASCEFEAFGLGGDGLRAQGLEAIADVSSISVIGLAEVARVYFNARKIFKCVLDRVRAQPPDVAVLIDFPEFNLRLAPKLKELGIPVVYYVSPQVWAWRRGRVKTMAKCIDQMLVFFPFEVDFYRGRLAVTHVGHPLIDEVPELVQVWDDADRSGAARDHGSGSERIALLPGSRSSEVRRLLPVLLESIRVLRERRPRLEGVLIQAAALDGRLTDRLIADSGVEVRKVAAEERFAAIASAHLALCASGTATLEVGLLRTPMIVVYRIGKAGYWLGRLIVRVPFVSLVNLVLGKGVVPELIQDEVRVDRIAAEAAALLDDRERRDVMRAGLRGLRRALGEGGASSKAAGEVLHFLEGTSR